MIPHRSGAENQRVELLGKRMNGWQEKSNDKWKQVCVKDFVMLWHYLDSTYLRLFFTAGTACSLHT